MEERRCQARAYEIQVGATDILCVGGVRGPATLVEFGLGVQGFANAGVRWRAVLASSASESVATLRRGQPLVRGMGDDALIGGAYVHTRGSYINIQPVRVPLWMPIDSGTQYVVVGIRHIENAIVYGVASFVAQLPAAERVAPVQVVGGPLVVRVEEGEP